jgi:hypothetical protein
MVNYQESHDEERLQYKNEQYGNGSSGYSIKDTATGLLRDELAAAFWAMIPGPKMLWEFGELGYDYPINWCPGGTVDNSCRLSPKPARWDYLGDARRRHLHDLYASLFRLNDSFPSLAVASSFAPSLGGAFRTLTLTGDGVSVVVVGNFDVVPATAQVSFPAAGQWYNYAGADSLPATGGPQPLTLNAGEYRVYTSRNLKDTTVAAPGPPARGGAEIVIYPNPVQDAAPTIRVSLPVAADVSLSVYSLMGARLGVVQLGRRPAGQFTISSAQLSLHLNSLGKGAYQLRMDYGQQRVCRSFILLR